MKNYIFSIKLSFPKNIPLGEGIAVVKTLRKFTESWFFFLKIRKSLKHYINFQKKKFFLQNIHGYVGGRFHNSGEFFAKSEKQPPRIEKRVFLFGKNACYIVLVDIYCSFGNTEKSLPPLSQKLQYYSGKSTIFRNSFLKFCSVSVPLNTLNVVLTPLNIF